MRLNSVAHICKPRAIAVGDLMRVSGHPTNNALIASPGRSGTLMHVAIAADKTFLTLRG